MGRSTGRIPDAVCTVLLAYLTERKWRRGSSPVADTTFTMKNGGNGSLAQKWHGFRGAQAVNHRPFPEQSGM